MRGGLPEGKVPCKYILKILKEDKISACSSMNVSIIILLIHQKEVRNIILFFFSPTQTNEKKGDQPPEAKKPKIKVKNVELPIEANLVWQLGKDLLNMYIETEVS